MMVVELEKKTTSCGEKCRSTEKKKKSDKNTEGRFLSEKITDTIFFYDESTE